MSTIAGGGTSSNITDSNITQCNSTLATNEVAGDQANALCECVGSSTTGASVDVTAFDEAQINCSPVGTPFTISKTCTPSGVGTFAADLKVTNGGSNSLSCSGATDQTVATNPGGAVSCPISGGTPATLTSSATIAVNGGSGQTGDFTFSINSTSTVYNEACVTCAEPSVTCTGSGQGTCNTLSGMTAACVSGVCNYTPSSAAQATCPVVSSCFSRTPGYWGTHPQVTQQVLSENGGSVTVCGIPLTTTLAFGGQNLGKLGPPYSTTEDLCGTGGPDFKPANTSPQQLQLIRQCTSAALNLVATGKGSVGAGIVSCDTNNPTIGAVFNSCCIVGPTGGAPVCDSGAKGTAIDASNCISALDTFNNEFEGTDFTAVGLVNSPAEPQQCQIANGNGDVNGGRNLGTK